MTPVPPNLPTPSRSAPDSSDLELILPRKLKGPALIGLLTFIAGAVGGHLTLAAKADAAADAAARAPQRVLELVAPRIKGLELDRDAATIERRSAADSIDAVRLYLCRECERTRRQQRACDDICGRGR